MTYARQNITVVPEILIDSETLSKMRFDEMLGRIDQMRATGRYIGYEIHMDGSLNAIVAVPKVGA